MAPGVLQSLRLSGGELHEMFRGGPSLVPPPPSPFVIGETMPWFDIMEEDLDLAEKNMGLPEGITPDDLEPWPYPEYSPGVYRIIQSQVPGNGILQGYDFGDHHLDVYAKCTLDVFSARITPANTANVDYGLRALNAAPGAGADHEVILLNGEVHNRAQKNISIFKGRNLSGEKIVGTGGSDIFQGVQRQSTVGGSVIGSAPANYLTDFRAVFFSGLAWWVNNFATHAQTHIDCYQTDGGIENMLKKAFGFAFLAHVSPFVGTGTPGSGRETNPFYAAGNTGGTYNQTQAAMAAERATYLNQWSNPDTSFGGEAWVRGTAGVDTSQACLMINRQNADFQQGWMSGGHAAVNFYDSNLPDNPAVTLKRNRIWRDAGVQLFGRAGRTYPGIPESGADANVNDVGAPITIYEN